MTEFEYKTLSIDSKKTEHSEKAWNCTESKIRRSKEMWLSVLFCNQYKSSSKYRLLFVFPLTLMV